MKNKKGYISIEAIIVCCLTVLFGLFLFNNIMSDTSELADDISKEIAASDSYLSENIKDSYYSDFSGLELDSSFSASGEDIKNMYPSFVYVEEIKVGDGKGILYLEADDGEIYITPEIWPSDASVQELSWHHEEDGIISVSREKDGNGGYIRPLKKGTSKIEFRATDGSNKNLILTVHVIQPVEDLIIDKEEITLSYSGTQSDTIQATLLPEGEDAPDDKRLKGEFPGGLGEECLEAKQNKEDLTFKISLDAIDDISKPYCIGEYKYNIYTYNEEYLKTVKIRITE